MIHCIENQRNVVALQAFWWRLLKYPNVVEIAWYHMEHTHEDGTPAHGTLDPNSMSRRSHQAPCIFKHLKEWLDERLDKGLTTKQI
jgi:hypothetical protein